MKQIENLVSDQLRYCRRKRNYSTRKRTRIGRKVFACKRRVEWTKSKTVEDAQTTNGAKIQITEVRWKRDLKMFMIEIVDERDEREDATAKGGDKKENFAASFVDEIGGRENAQEENDGEENGNVVGGDELFATAEGCACVRHYGLDVSECAEDDYSLNQKYTLHICPISRDRFYVSLLGFALDRFFHGHILLIDRFLFFPMTEPFQAFLSFFFLVFLDEETGRLRNEDECAHEEQRDEQVGDLIVPIAQVASQNIRVQDTCIGTDLEQCSYSASDMCFTDFSQEHGTYDVDCGHTKPLDHAHDVEAENVAGVNGEDPTESVEWACDEESQLSPDFIRQPAGHEWND